MKFSDFTVPEIDRFLELCNFTEDEEQVFKLLIRGKNAVSISNKLNVSERTVYRMKKKMEIKIKKVGDDIGS